MASLAAVSPARRAVFFWQLQFFCNYRCPYCVYDGQWEDVLALDRPDIPLESWIAAWKRVHDYYGAAEIMLTGGEPTAHPRLIELLRALTDVHHVSFDTNLSLSWPKLRRLLREVGPSRLRIDASFHPTACSLNEFLGRAKALRDNGFNFVCRLVAWPPLFASIPEYRESFSREGLPFAVYPFQGAFEGRKFPESYSPEERALISGGEISGEGNKEQSELVRHILNKGAESPCGRLCRSGFEYARVMTDGTVHRCQQYESRAWEPLGNLLDPEFRLRDGPSVCRSNECEFEFKYLVPEAAG